MRSFRSEPKINEDITMNIIEDGVFTKTSYFGRGVYRFDSISYDHKMLLQSISKRQRAKYIRYGIVPQQLLVVLWENGYLPGVSRPTEGMRIARLLDMIEEGKYQNKQHGDRGIWLYEQIVQDELMPTKRRLKR